MRGSTALQLSPTVLGLCEGPGPGYPALVRFDEAFLDEIKSRLRPSDVIGRTVKLQKRGREFVGLSPFTKEKTPSFYVYDDHFHCFGCGAHGDAVTFVMQAEGASPEKAETQATVAHLIDVICKLLHPFMPYLTEELWAAKAAVGAPRPPQKDGDTLL